MQVIPMLSEALARLGRHIVQWNTASPRLVIQVSGSEQRPYCPHCGSERVRRHGRYWRRPADLPIFGSPVTLEVEVRRLRCMGPDCDGCTFGESLAPFVGRRCRYSERSRAALQRIGCAAAGQAGARLASALGLRATGDTILRTLRRLTTPESGEPRVVGIDDWALARGHRYGTVFVDLESRRPLDLVAGREVQEVREWLAQHPGIRIVARDRAGAYAQAARQALPDATQVADRWHLLSNLGEMAERVLLRCAAALRAAALTVNDDLRNESTANATAAEPPMEPAAPTPRARTRRSAQRRSVRLALYEEARRRHDQGQSTRSTARQMKLDIRTVRKFVRADTFPERADYPAQTSEIDPWRGHLESRWAEGCCNAMQLWREIRALGFRGGRSQVRDMFSGRRQQEGGPSRRSSSPLPARRSVPSPRRMRVHLFGSAKETELGCDEDRQWWRRYLEEVCRVEPAIDKVRDIGRRFVEMLRRRDAHALAGWLQQAHGSGVPELQRFASGIKADHDAVLAALSTPWSSGQVEGQINRLKYLKRQMYGRAHLDLLRIRVLHPT